MVSNDTFRASPLLSKNGEILRYEVIMTDFPQVET